MPPAKGESLAWLTIDDFSPGIITNSDYAFSGGPVPGNKLGQAQSAVGCIALPNGGLAPLPGIAGTIAPTNAPPGTVTKVGSPTIVNSSGISVGSFNFSRTGVVAGNLLIAVVWTGSHGNDVAGISGGGATWTLEENIDLAGIGDLEVWQGVGGTGGSITVGVTLGGTSEAGGILFEFHGADPSTPIEQKTTANGSGATMTAAAQTAGHTGDFILQCFNPSGVLNGPGPAAPWTQAISKESGGPNLLGVATQPGVANESYQAVWGQTGSTWESISIVIQPVQNTETWINGLFVTPGVLIPAANIPSVINGDELIYGMLTGRNPTVSSQDWSFFLEKLDVQFGAHTANSRVTLETLAEASDGTSVKGFVNMMTGGMSVISGQAQLSEPTIVPIGASSPIFVSLSGVVSGQPLVIAYFETGAGMSTLNVPTVVDNFSSHYSWTHITTAFGHNSGSDIDPWLVLLIGTGGAGESGVVTITSNTVTASGFGCAAYSCVGASTAAGTSAVDVFGNAGNASSETVANFVSLTPSLQGELAIFATLSDGPAIVGEPNPPFDSFPVTQSGSIQASLSVLANPMQGGALTPAWAFASSTNLFCQVGAIILPEYSTTYLPIWLLGFWFSGGTANAIYGGSPYQWIYPNLLTLNSSTPSELQPHATGYPADVLTHQNRLVLLSLINSVFGPTVNLATNEMFNYTEPPSSAILGNQLEYFVQEFPVGAGAWGSISASELFVVKHEGGGYVIQGDLNSPTVTRLPGVTPTYGLQSRTALTPIGVVYASQNHGLWAWNGGQQSVKISNQLDDNFFISSALGPNQVFLGPAVDIARWGDWIVCTNDWLFDTNLGGWWRLPASSIAPHLLYGVSGNSQSLYASLPNPTAAAAIDVYSRTSLADTFTWESFPIRDPRIQHDKPIQIHEVTVRAQGLGSVTVTVTGIGGASSATSSSPSATVPLSSNAQPVLQSFNAAMQAHDVIVNISSTGQSGGPAPTVYSVSVGWSELEQPVSPG